ncbi:hypothetical protein NONO_c15710 [Nocardia nova SH22a]|uniref:DUF4351 domain-containing protein n=1 Tax=Nocardia nova SH22a TaxID=1415166 RepID=W5TB20_9NOCA|nr:DUF4351 domain-containing protein [Nocardia nova]AHH16372.1 hypothetical protein NONO_c15710 [Nocardia nova SH22a]
MTTAEQLRAEGEARGQTKWQAKLLLRQLTVKFGPLPDHVIDRVRAGNPAELETWAERILTATTLDQFFA